MAQLNPVVGDVAANLQQIIQAAEQARDGYQADVIVFPELMLTGYPPEDLLLKPSLLKRVNQALQRLQQLQGIAVIVGHPEGQAGQALYNAASVIMNGQRQAVYYKQHLPNYGVFDEKRYFIAGEMPCVVEINGIKLGLNICEDLWFAEPTAKAADAGAEVIINLSASPYQMDKQAQRDKAAVERVIQTGLPLVYVNQTGGQDELVFDGGSFAFTATGQKVASAPLFVSGLYVLDIERRGETLEINGNLQPEEPRLAVIYQALITGLRDYIEKNHFPGVVLGLSGGIDSALVLALAVDAIGAERVHAVMMPSRYTADISLEDAKAMAAGLKVKYSVLPIEGAFNLFVDILADEFAGAAIDTTEENIQARCRAVLLMALSNKTGNMLLSTSNKSETAVGYSTLYGDMAGGFSPLKDVYKTLVYQLCYYRNQQSVVIPERIITRPPSAELAPNQRDDDSLPAYELLDGILAAYLESDGSFDELLQQGYDAEVLARVIKLVDRNEYKRRQAPPGILISERAFGRDRRYPITSGYALKDSLA